MKWTLGIAIAVVGTSLACSGSGTTEEPPQTPAPAAAVEPPPAPPMPTYCCCRMPTDPADASKGSSYAPMITDACVRPPAGNPGICLPADAAECAPKPAAPAEPAPEPWIPKGHTPGGATRAKPKP